MSTSHSIEEPLSRDRILTIFLSSIVHESTYRKERALKFVQRDRVLWVGATRYIVESKRYPATQNKPSKIHIINHLHDYNFQCDCEYSGVFANPFDVCSHILAVMLSICIRDGSLKMLEDREADRIKEAKGLVNERGVPIQGNEYPDHQKQKERIYNLLRGTGYWDIVLYEFSVRCYNPHTGDNNRNPYSLDVFASKIGKETNKIGIEINREETGGGHGSKITGPKDRNRAEEIESQHGIKVIQFNISHLKASDDMTVLEEIYQKAGITSQPV